MQRAIRTGLLAFLWSAALLILVAASPPGPQDSPQTPEPDPPRRPPVVAAWLRGSSGSLRPMVVIVAAHLNSYSEISAFSYTVERDGSLTANDPVTDAVLVDFARLNGIHVIPTVSSTWEAGNVLRVLRDPVLLAKHVAAIMKIASSPLVDGIDIDYENLPPDSRGPFTNFVRTLAARLHLQGKTLSITVPAKVREEDSCVICRFADYAALGKAADQIRVMAYEYHGRNGAPGPNAPIWWVRQVMEYAVSQVPSDKVVLGIHLYAYDWGGKETTAMWWSDVQALQQRYHGESTYVESDARGQVGESVMTYSIPGPPCPRHFLDCVPVPAEPHTVWYVDAQYVAASWQIVQDLKLGGIVMWRPGGEDPAIWDVLNPAPTPTPTSAPTPPQPFG